MRDVKMAASVGFGAAAHSMLLAPTLPWLWCEGLRAQSESSGFHPTSFQRCSSDRMLQPKNISNEKYISHFSYFLECSGAANV
jgi:hypothetical protein